jgi:hypothetical protein
MVASIAFAILETQDLSGIACYTLSYERIMESVFSPLQGCTTYIIGQDKRLSRESFCLVAHHLRGIFRTFRILEKALFVMFTLLLIFSLLVRKGASERASQTGWYQAPNLRGTVCPSSPSFSSLTCQEEEPKADVPLLVGYHRFVCAHIDYLCLVCASS